MKVVYLKPSLTQEFAGLHLEPESDRDRDTCNRLISDDLVTGCGYDPESGLVIHTQVPLASRCQ